ncbi:MAG: hypothetical protein ACNA8L_04840 [Luteolibacter sp.]
MKHKLLVFTGIAVTAFGLGSCGYGPIHDGGGYSRSSVAVGYGYGHGYGGNSFSTSFFWSTGDPRWGYDPYARCYYDHHRRAYYDPYLYGYYPIGYRPPILVGVPHPYGYRQGWCPPPRRITNITVVNYRHRESAYRNTNHTWSKNVRYDSKHRTSNSDFRSSERIESSDGSRTRNGFRSRDEGRVRDSDRTRDIRTNWTATPTRSDAPVFANTSPRESRARLDGGHRDTGRNASAAGWQNRNTAPQLPEANPSERPRQQFERRERNDIRPPDASPRMPRGSRETSDWGRRQGADSVAATPAQHRGRGSDATAPNRDRANSASRNDSQSRGVPEAAEPENRGGRRNESSGWGDRR